MFAVFVPDTLQFESGLSILLGLIVLILIFTLLLIYSLKRGNHGPRQKTIKMIKIPCPVCKGATKLPAQAHDSPDIQFVPCGNCGGAGEIFML